MSKLSDLTTKVTPVAADLLTWLDSEDSNVQTKNKNFLLSSLWSAIFGSRDSDDIWEWATNKYASTTNVNAAWATMNTDTDLSANDWFLDEDNMISDDATKVASQQSVKAYVDNFSIPDASESVKGKIELSDAAQATAWTDDLTAMTPKKVKDNYWLRWVISTTLTFTGSWTTLAVAHWLSKIPTKLRFDAGSWDNFWVYWLDWATAEQKCSFSTASAAWNRAGIFDWQIAAYNQTGSDYARRAVTSVDVTNINLTRIWTWSIWSTPIDYIITCEI